MCCHGDQTRCGPKVDLGWFQFEFRANQMVNLLRNYGKGFFCFLAILFWKKKKKLSYFIKMLQINNCNTEELIGIEVCVGTVHCTTTQF